MLQAFEDRLGVERRQCPRIHQVAGDPGVLESVDGLLGKDHHPSDRHDRAVIALTRHRCLAERNEMLAFRDITFAVVQCLVLEKYDGIIVANGGL